MGWLKKLIKSTYDIIDPLMPESIKKIDDKMLSAVGLSGVIEGQGKLKNSSDASGAAATDPVTNTAPALTQEEAEGLSSKRLARLGRYFTSPLGVLSGASTGSQKVFS